MVNNRELHIDKFDHCFDRLLIFSRKESAGFVTGVCRLIRKIFV